MLKKTLKIIGIVLLLLIIFVVGSFYYVHSNFKKMSQVTLVTDFVKDTIPFTYATSGHILLPVKVNGSSQAYNFLLDSGASNYIFDNFPNVQKFENNGSQIGRSSSGNLFFTKIKTIDSLQIGSLIFKNINAQFIDFNHDCTDNIYGFIGKETMRHLIWQIDFKNQHIILSKKLDDLEFQENKIEIPLTENKYSHHLYTSLQFRKNTKPTSVIVDLGNSGTLSLNENDIHKDSIHFESKKIYGTGSIGLSSADKKQSNHMYYMIDSIYFKKTNYSISNIQVMSSPKSINMLGLGFFKNYRTTISWQDKKLIFEPYDSVQIFKHKTFGYTTRYDTQKNKVLIRSISENSPASIKKLPLNSEVISINDEVFTDMNVYCKYKQSKKGDSIRLKVKQIDIIKEYLLIKKHLFN